MTVGGTRVSRYVVFSGVLTVLLGAAVPARAQSAPPEDPAKSQVLLYELALRRAVEIGGQRLAQQALVLVPELTLATAEQAIVRGFRLPKWGYVFDVQAPNIKSTMMVWDMMLRRRPSGPEVQPSGQPVSDRVAATGLVPADPVAPATPAFDPDRAYTTYIKEALIEALLDNSVILALAPGEHLTIVASGIDQPNSNPLYRPSSGKLIMTISAADLQDLRSGRITRDQAKERIAQERF